MSIHKQCPLWLPGETWHKSNEMPFLAGCAEDGGPEMESTALCFPPP
jgi:hypothetical protein